MSATPTAKVGHPVLIDPTLFTMTVGAVTTAPTKATSPAIDAASYWKVGKLLFVRWLYKQANTTGAAAGSGIYKFALPAGFTADTNFIAANANAELADVVGQGGFNTPADLKIPIKLYLYDTTHLAARYLSAGSFAADIDDGVGFAAGSWSMSFVACIPVL